MTERIKVGLLSLFLLLVPFSPLVFVACDDGHPEFDIALEADYSDVIKAINEGDRSLAEKMALIQAAVSNGLAGNNTMMDLIQDALSSLDGTMDAKLEAIETAMSDQTTTLEQKFLLVEAARTSGFGDSNTLQGLLDQAVGALTGTFDEKLGAVQEAIQGKTTSLENKLGLVESAVRKGFADAKKAQELIQQAIESVGESQKERMEAIDKALENQSLELSAKMALIETALNKGFATNTTEEALIQTALKSLRGSVTKKMNAIEAAVNSQAVSLEAKLDLLDETLDITGRAGLMELIRQAVASLEGTEKDKLDAVKKAMESQTTGLETKLGLISTTLTDGFSDEKDALDAFETAINTSLGKLDQSLSTDKKDILTQLTAVGAKLSTQELSGALADIVSAIDSKTQSEEEQLAAIRQVVNSLADNVSGSAALFYASDPKETIKVTKGESFSVKLRVDPPETELVKDNLQIDVVSHKLFYPEGTGIGTEPEHFTLTSLDKDPDVAGQYNVTVSTNSTVRVWDESILAFVYNFGNQKHKRLFTTDPFPVTMMPRTKDALDMGYYPNAAFQMRDTFLVLGNKTILDTLGNIYYSLGSVAFKTEDGKESRTYTAENLSSVAFEQPGQASPASVFTVFNKGKHFVYFYPDTVGNTAWRGFKRRFADDHEYQDVTGRLALTDNQGATDYIDLSMKWYTAWTISYEIVDNRQDTLKPSHFDFNGKTYVRDFSQLWSQLQEWGLGYSDIKRAGLQLENVTKGRGDGYKLVYLQLPDDSPSASLEVADGIKPVKGDQYQALGVFRLRSRPSDVDPSFRPTQYLYKYQFTLKVTKDDDTQ